ncbi:hypothetical protein BDN72DRAFT_846706 [Pluteus cervinus]|uniref:Uncharacterized protein n=1 Tax=Pluteus cervinus TaxID=181527 RepID=A0ACD3AG17_9AGAR|nr:hypothetical protein BDN72DRAFT_846706 [Pluteus cervinus]
MRMGSGEVAFEVGEEGGGGGAWYRSWDGIWKSWWWSGGPVGLGEGGMGLEGELSTTSLYF